MSRDTMVEGRQEVRERSALLDHPDIVVPVDSAVLIRGETNTRTAMIARAIQRGSNRPGKVIAILLALFPAISWSQTQLATVFGTINDPSGAVIPGSQVTIVNQNTGLKRATLTDMTGQYHLAGLPTGRYTLRTEKE